MASSGGAVLKHLAHDLMFRVSGPVAARTERQTERQTDRQIDR
jgi:hypothetical protein